MSSETRRPEVTSYDGIPLVSSCSAAVDMRCGDDLLDDVDGISQCHVTTSLFDGQSAPRQGGNVEGENWKIKTHDVRITQEGKKGSKSDLMSGESRQKKIKVAVVVVACMLLITSFVLVGVTLSMSSHIDDMVRKTYEPPSIYMTTRNQHRNNRNINNNDDFSHSQLHHWQTTTRQ